jgi:hypothetical protein
MGLDRMRAAISIAVALIACCFILGLPLSWGNVGSISPNPPTAGQPFDISGIGSGNILVLFSGSGCSGDGTPLTASPLPADEPYTITTSIDSPDQYSVSDTGNCVDFTVIPAATTTTTTVTTPIPEYPYGLPLLAILTILCYAVIKRRIRN